MEKKFYGMDGINKIADAIEKIAVVGVGRIDIDPNLLLDQAMIQVHKESLTRSTNHLVENYIQVLRAAADVFQNNDLYFKDPYQQIDHIIKLAHNTRSDVRRKRDGKSEPGPDGHP
jgi:hypothetical protein